MNKKLIIASATLASLCCLYIARLNDKAVTFAGTIEPAKAPDMTFSSTELTTISSTPDDRFVAASAKIKRKISTIFIDPRIDNLVYGDQGTGLFFPAGSFVDKTGRSIETQIKIKLEECYDIPTILAAKLSTTSNGRLLETAGMIDIHGFSDGSEVELGQGASYKIYFPKNDNKKDDFKLFYGEWNEDNIINWNLADAANFQEKVDDDIFLSEESDAIFLEEDMDEQETISLLPYKSILGDDEYCFLQICESNLRRGTQVSKMDYFNWKLQDGQTLNQWFVSNFNPDMKMLEEFCILGLRSEITFKVDKRGAFESYYISKSSNSQYDREIVSFLETMPPLDLKQLMPTFTDDHACILTFGSKQGRQQDTFAAEFRKKFKADPKKPIDGVDASTIDFFIFSSSELGWINCDRFYDNEGPTVDYVVENLASPTGSVSMIFEDINSVLKGVNEGSHTIFADVPADRKIRLVGIDNPGMSPVMCIAKGNTSEKKKRLDAYKPFTLGELEAQFGKTI